jgi:AhpD family alkylhydroperoxidase
MSIISTTTSQAFPWYVKLFFWNQKRKYGVILEPALLWGRSPRVFAMLALLYGALDRDSSPLSPVLRTLVTVRVSQINGCPFCVDINSATAMKRGITEAKLSSLADYTNSVLYSNKEKAALAYAEAMTYSDRQPTDEQFETLRCHFDDAAIIELTGLIGFQNMSSKFNAALGVRPQGFCSIAPLPGMEKKQKECVMTQLKQSSCGCREIEDAERNNLAVPLGLTEH